MSQVTCHKIAVIGRSPGLSHIISVQGAGWLQCRVLGGKDSGGEDCTVGPELKTMQATLGIPGDSTYGENMVN